MITEANFEDLNALMKLYIHIHPELASIKSEHVQKVWSDILSNPNHHVIVVKKDEKIVSSCTLVIIPNLTHHLRPYALVENVMTHQDERNQGLASACLDYAKTMAKTQHCYKIMLMTGSKRESTLRFYEKAGYNKHDKTAFVMWL